MSKFDHDRLSPRKSAASRWFIAAFFVATVSCGERNSGVYPVTGRVLYQGLPAAGAVVYFSRTGSTAVSDQTVMGIVRDDGAYELVCGAIGKGAPPGDYDIFIEWREVLNQQRGGPQRGPDKLNGRFAHRNPARFHASIKAEKNLLPPLELTDE